MRTIERMFVLVSCVLHAMTIPKVSAHSGCRLKERRGPFCGGFCGLTSLLARVTALGSNVDVGNGQLCRGSASYRNGGAELMMSESLDLGGRRLQWPQDCLGEGCRCSRKGMNG